MSTGVVEGDVFHFRSVSNLSTRSEGSVSRSEGSSITSDSVTRKIKSWGEFPPPGAGFVSGSSEDVSSKRRESTARHSCCSDDTSKLANDEFVGIEQHSLKFVVLGDSAVGKTSLMMSFTTDKIPEKHAPTIYDKFNVSQTVYGKRMSVTWCDTAGQEDFAHLRPLCYPQVNAAVVCFSVINRESFEHVKDKWVKELQHHCPKVPIVLVGTQTDKREALKSTKSKLAQSHVVTKSEGIKMALFIKAATYMECSALNHHNVQNVFNETVLAALGLGSDKALPTHSQCTPCAIL